MSIGTRKTTIFEANDRLIVKKRVTSSDSFLRINCDDIL